MQCALLDGKRLEMRALEMRILVDADACPVVGVIIELGRKWGREVALVCDTAHRMERDGARTVTVDQGADSADLALANMAARGDIVVTQDYGVAALALGKGARAVSQNGMEYTDGNMDALLMMRHEAGKVRRAGGRTKGPGKRTREMDGGFRAKLEEMLKEG